MEWVAIALAVASLIGGIINNVSNQRAAIDADSRALENQKKLMEYQNQLQQETNTIATQKGHMAAAGYSPALMYGASSMPLASVTGGSGQGSVPNLSNIFGRVDPNNLYEAQVTKNSQDMMRQRLQSDISLNRQKELNLAAQTAEQVRYTGLQKQLEKTIIDQSIANLHLSQSQKEALDFSTRRGNALLPLELEEKGLLNKETAARTQKVVSDTLKNSWEIAEIRANIGRIGKLNDVSDVERQNIIESTKKTALGRIMEQYGLSARSLPPSLRGKGLIGDIHRYWTLPQVKGAITALVSLGFSPDEASQTALYYSASDPKDVTPSAVNALSRLVSAAIIKK